VRGESAVNPIPHRVTELYRMSGNLAQALTSPHRACPYLRSSAGAGVLVLGATNVPWAAERGKWGGEGTGELIPHKNH
jgi:hypothetical protein